MEPPRLPDGQESLFAGSKWHLPILILLALILFFWNIHVIPLTDGDSAFYAKIAKNIVESGDWLTMHYGNEGTIVNKPPLMMWLTAASFKVFGINDFAVSFWHSIFALLIVVFTYQLAKELLDRKPAFISALILATSAQFFYQARSPLQDIPLTLFILLSIYTFVLYERYGNLGYFYLSPVFVALAVLTKGPVGLVLPALILFIYIYINKIKLPSTFHIVSAITLFLAVTLPWFIIEYRILGQKFIDVFIGYNFGRYLRPMDTIGSEATKYKPIMPQYDFYSYFLQILILAIPWSGFFYPALFKSFKDRKLLLPMIFALSVIIFFSLSLNYKISRYILPAFPAMAILIGRMFTYSEGEQEASRPKGTRDTPHLSAGYWINGLLVLPALLISALLLYRSFSGIGELYLPILLPFLLLLSLGIFISTILGIINKFELSFAVLVVSSFISYLLLINGLANNYSKLNPIEQFCKKINPVIKPGDIACQYKGTDAHFMIYYANSDVVLIRDKADMKALLLSGKKVYCITENEEAYRELTLSLKGRINELGNSANFSLFTN